MFVYYKDTSWIAASSQLAWNFMPRQLVDSHSDFITLETILQFMKSNIPEDLNLQWHCCENPESYKCSFLLLFRILLSFSNLWCMASSQPSLPSSHMSFSPLITFESEDAVWDFLNKTVQVFLISPCMLHAPSFCPHSFQAPSPFYELCTPPEQTFLSSLTTLLTPHTYLCKFPAFNVCSYLVTYFISPFSDILYMVLSIETDHKLQHDSAATAYWYKM